MWYYMGRLASPDVAMGSPAGLLGTEGYPVDFLSCQSCPYCGSPTLSFNLNYSFCDVHGDGQVVKNDGAVASAGLHRAGVRDLA